jgi:hypothetical protein
MQTPRAQFLDFRMPLDPGGFDDALRAASALDADASIPFNTVAIDLTAVSRICPSFAQTAATSSTGGLSDSSEFSHCPISVLAAIFQEISPLTRSDIKILKRAFALACHPDLYKGHHKLRATHWMAVANAMFDLAAETVQREQPPA